MAQEVGIDELLSKLGPQHRLEVEAVLAKGQGMALYRDGGGAATVAVSFGTRDADIVGLPPKLYGGGELGEFVSPQRRPASMRSPLLDAVGGPPQITAPRRSPSQTAHPEVLLGGRTSSHPRGDSEYIRPGRTAAPVAPVESPAPEERLSEGQAWLRDHLT